jgi:two-component system nitrogen regulation response regulator NtrX
MKTRRILIVDDEPGIRTSLGAVLEDEAYTVESVGDGEACLSILDKHPFDCILLDVWLPGMDGMEVLNRVQERVGDERPAVVMISGHGNIETALRSR